MSSFRACQAASPSCILSQAFVDAWLTHRSGDKVLCRDVGLQPPSFVTESWIAEAFIQPDACSPAMAAELALSDMYLDELEQADVIVMGTPMYNYGMPAHLKVWFDQVIRVGRPFPSTSPAATGRLSQS